MGVNAQVCLPRDVRLRDVSTAIGILAGLGIEWEKSGYDKDLMFLRVKGVQEKSGVCPEMVNIIISGELVDGEKNHFVNYFFESSDANFILLYPKSTAFWIAIGIELCKFFGGKIQFNDCKGGWNRRYKKPRKKNNPDDGRPWTKFQKELSEIKPLTMKDLRRCDKYAAYKEDWTNEPTQEDVDRLTDTLNRIEKKKKKKKKKKINT